MGASQFLKDLWSGDEIGHDRFSTLPAPELTRRHGQEARSATRRRPPVNSTYAS